MSDKLTSNALHLLEAEEAFSTALYAGPGLEGLAASLYGNLAERIVAFTLPTRVQSLIRSSFAEPSQIECHAVVLSTHSGAAKVQNFNIRSYSSLRSATGLKQIFPGLRETDQTNIDTISPEKAIELSNLRGNNNLLILGAFGCEMEILNIVLSTEGDPIFARIILMVPDIAMFEGGCTANALIDRLEQANYRRIWTDRSDPDFPIAAFDLDLSRIADRAALLEREQGINALSAKIDQLTIEINNMQSQRDLAFNEAAEARQKENQARESAQVLEHEKERFKAELVEAQAKIAIELDKLSALGSERDALNESLQKLERSIESLKAEHQEAMLSEKDAANENIQKLERYIESLKVEHQEALANTLDEISDIRQKKMKAEDDLTLALRLQGLRESDLSEIRLRYKSLKAENAHMADLLRSIVHNLTFLQQEKESGKKSAKSS